MKLAGTCSFIHQLFKAGTSGWICPASRVNEYHSKKTTADVTTSSTKPPSARVAYLRS
jgi:hypothetical protein